jgi:hypothetical protein
MATASSVKAARSCRWIQYVDDLPELVQINPPSGDFHIGLVHEPPLTGAVPARAGRVDQQRRDRCTQREMLT